MADRIKEIKVAWQEKLQTRSFCSRFLFSLILLAFVLTWFARFLDCNEENTGFSFTDPFLKLFNPLDVTWITFGLIYAALVIALVSLSFHPENFLLAIQSYTFVALLRLITIYFLPLDAPVTIIPLKDPFIEFFGGGRTLYRDLFFSGHTSTMFLFSLTATSKKLKYIFLVCTVLVAGCVLIQHVHYTIDVIAAPFFAYTSYRIALLINNKG
ncbi:MAG: phosphatase PAP2-related protein [Bacteroidota bacterium]